ncbi:hypothetical protein JL475_00400 [Streptomyces sp. M2CJ-2]|uniref:hypothetical protein n=1 Tax=Streptomyces sp. M2CJ-2 TaxID=2803948 RepID=UPI001922E355|nr:hypothetical protein [Streptomyces sp. M2CJ-2]MBL3664506.1 hypothetical protein [Streptomyces sp. M2CJ-2]
MDDLTWRLGQQLDEEATAAYEVAAYRGTRNWHLKIADYRKTVSDGEGKPPAREQAEALRRDLAEQSSRSRLGWTHIDIQARPREPEEKP